MSQRFKIYFSNILRRELNPLKVASLKTALEHLGSQESGKKVEMIESIIGRVLKEVISFKGSNNSASLAFEFTKKWLSQFVKENINGARIDFLGKVIECEMEGGNFFELMKSLDSTVSNVWSEEELAEYPCICPRIPSSLALSSPEESCYRCGQFCHTDCLWGRPKGDEVFECPSCFLVNCLPRKRVEKVLFAGYLQTCKKEKIEYRVNFRVPPELRQEKSVHFEARCVRLKSELNQFQITWPDNCTLSLNSQKLAEEFKPLPTNSPLKRRRDEEVQLERFRMCLDDYEELLIEERHQHDSAHTKYEFCNHFLMVVAVKHQEVQELVARYKACVQPAEESKMALRDYLGSSQSDITIEKLSISLRCQIFANKIQIPVRSRNCTNHFQPFDLHNFLKAHHSSNSVQRYKCPICKKRAYDLLIDEHILNTIKVKGQDIDHIEGITFRADGEPFYESEVEASDRESSAEADENFAQGIEEENVEYSENQNQFLDVDLITESDEQRNVVVIQVDSSSSEELMQTQMENCDINAQNNQMSPEEEIIQQKKTQNPNSFTRYEPLFNLQRQKGQSPEKSVQKGKRLRQNCNSGSSTVDQKSLYVNRNLIDGENSLDRIRKTIKSNNEITGNEPIVFNEKQRERWEKQLLARIQKRQQNAPNPKADNAEAGNRTTPSEEASLQKGSQFTPCNSLNLQDAEKTFNENAIQISSEQEIQEGQIRFPNAQTFSKRAEKQEQQNPRPRDSKKMTLYCQGNSKILVENSRDDGPEIKLSSYKFDCLQLKQRGSEAFQKAKINDQRVNTCSETLVNSKIIEEKDVDCFEHGLKSEKAASEAEIIQNLHKDIEKIQIDLSKKRTHQPHVETISDDDQKLMVTIFSECLEHCDYRQCLTFEPLSDRVPNFK